MPLVTVNQTRDVRMPLSVDHWIQSVTGSIVSRRHELMKSDPRCPHGTVLLTAPSHSIISLLVCVQVNFHEPGKLGISFKRGGDGVTPQVKSLSEKGQAAAMPELAVGLLLLTVNKAASLGHDKVSEQIKAAGAP